MGNKCLTPLYPDFTMMHLLKRLVQECTTNTLDQSLLINGYLALLGQRPLESTKRFKLLTLSLHKPRTHMQQQKIMTGNRIQPLKSGKCIIYPSWFWGKKFASNTSCQLAPISPSLCVYILLIESRAMTGKGKNCCTLFLRKRKMDI